MMIAERNLTLKKGPQEMSVPVRIHAPENMKDEWICRFEIGWPEGRTERWGAGIDAVQALEIALRMIGAILYTSQYHETGNLSWLDAGRGYGFPVTNGIRDLLVGDDKQFF